MDIKTFMNDNGIYIKDYITTKVDFTSKKVGITLSTKLIEDIEKILN